MPGVTKEQVARAKEWDLLLVDIEAKLKDGKGKGYERWA